MCLILLLPLSALVMQLAQMSWAQYWEVITNPQGKSKMLRLKNHFIAAAGGSRQNYRPMNSMFQFAHVSRKTVVLQ